MNTDSLVRPRDLALLMLASDDLLPRQRARDQAPDLAGLALERRVLDRLAALDPEPDQMEAALLQIVEEIGSPTGPTRAVAGTIRDDWQIACSSPDLVTHLLAQATRQKPGGPSRGG